MTETLRLSKLMAQRGLCSRREADRYIERGWVTVDGDIVDTLGTKVTTDCTIELAPAARRQQGKLVTVLLNKPVGYVSGQPEGGYPTAASLIVAENRHRGDRTPINYNSGHRYNLAPAGRLDIDSQGLLVLTQDGRIARQLVGENTDTEKEYLVRVEGEITEQVLERLGSGLSLDGRLLKPVKVERIKPNQLRMILLEGRKRQIRRMCERVDLKVTGLKRVRIGKIKLGSLPEGRWRYLPIGSTFR